ncbi:VirK/YbjX family protein [Lonepinella sp. BR2271]|uniref:VirK/YbjX family protein n=1 Tax=Lonepinella sp. BR2271 TaxID=3434550 RepID=UPI003F6DF49A
MTLYPNRGKKSYRLKRFRFHLRSWLNRRYVQAFESFVNQSINLIELLKPRPNYSYPVVHRFLDKRFNARQRFQVVCDNLTFLPEKLQHQGIPPLWEQPINFGEIIPDFELLLMLNEHQAMEGYWTLELRHRPTQELIYLLTFGKIDEALLIGVIQGPNIEGSKEIVKLLTKKCHGLRPAYFMVEAMKALTQVLGYEKLLGIPQKYQNKSRWIQSKRYIVNYDTIFRECAGVLGQYWQLPLHSATKSLEDIPSHKRSMYRKRYAMLENLGQIMAEKLIKSDK